MTTCPFCQFRNEDGSLFCEQCKSDLSMIEAPAAGAAVMAVAAVAMPAAAVVEAVAAVPFEVVPVVPFEAVPPPPLMAAVEIAPPPVVGLEAPEDLPTPERMADLAMEALPAVAEPFQGETMVAAAPPTVEALIFPDAAPPPPIMPTVEVVPAPLPGVPVAAVAVAAEPVATPEPAAPPPVPTPSASVAVGTQPKLVVTRGLKIGMEYTLYEGHNFIGRMDEKPVDIDLEDQESAEKVYCSRQHALVTFENGQVLIEDLNSANGTFVNRNRIYPGQSKPLQAGDTIQIGTVQMRVKM